MISGGITQAIIIPFGTVSVRHTIFYLIISILGGMLPDIDSSNSRSKQIIFNFLAFSGIYFYSLRYDQVNSIQAIIEIVLLCNYSDPQPLDFNIA